MRLVLDTNVVVSALLWRGVPFRLLGAIRERSEVITLFTSTALLTELADVLARPSVAGQLAVIQRSAAQVLADLRGSGRDRATCSNPTRRARSGRRCGNRHRVGCSR